ncbi:hypothetical protein F4820DRAFT_449483 [Hypoxylon rubiginosum]|uniref:Uncharacterized protein n=1 Tax=Hypoxylon rubiginosum TaxID=110542 RepID=A0ACB9YX61_9PEZI|nr:hypothetical protein F4820DRAFT_449483 [Hypoxylon rubiginosum]
MKPSLAALALLHYTAASARWVQISPCPCADACALTNVTMPDTNACVDLPFPAYSWTQDGPGTVCVFYAEAGCGGAAAGLYGCRPDAYPGCCFDDVRMSGTVAPWAAARCYSATQ